MPSQNVTQEKMIRLVYEVSCQVSVAFLFGLVPELGRMTGPSWLLSQLQHAFSHWLASDLFSHPKIFDALESCKATLTASVSHGWYVNSFCRVIGDMLKTKIKILLVFNSNRKLNVGLWTGGLSFPTVGEFAVDMMVNSLGLLSCR